MRIMAMGDLHLRRSSPENRKDDFPATQTQKITRAFAIARREGCQAVIAPGDVFDSFRVPDGLKESFIRLLNDQPFHFIGEFGQHDMHYHGGDLRNTPLGVVIAGAARAKLPPFSLNGVQFYGAGWDKPIPAITTPDSFNILVTHRMILKDKLLFPGQESGFDWGAQLLEDHDFHVIVSGDNHKQFMIEHKGKVLINAGSLMRQSIDQMDHKPAVYIIDTDAGDVKRIALPIRDPEEVFNTEVIQRIETRNENLDAFIAGLKDGTNVMALDFTAALTTYCKDNNVPASVKAIIDEALEA